MTHSHLTPEEIEFLRSSTLDEAPAKTDRISISGTHAISDVPRALTEKNETLAQHAFDDDLISGLRVIHDRFAEHAAPALQGPLRAPVAIRVERVEQRTFSEIVFSLKNPTCLQVLADGRSTVSPILLEMPLDVLFPMMDRLLGGQEGDKIVPRALTEIERRLVSRLTGLLLTPLSRAWSRVAAVRWAVELLESNPQTVRCVPPGEPCAVVVMGISFGRARGQIRGVFPHHAVAFVRERIAAEKPDSEESSRHAAGDVGEHADSVPLRVTLAESTLHRSDLLGLQVGDILATESDASAPTTVDVDEDGHFVARIGTHEGYKAVRIEGPRED